MTLRSLFALALTGIFGLAQAATTPAPALTIPQTKEVRNRANVLLAGASFPHGTAAALQERFPDEIAVFTPAREVATPADLLGCIDGLGAERRWDVWVLSLGAGAQPVANYARDLQRLVRSIHARGGLVLWASLPAGEDRVAMVRLNDAARAIVRAENVAVADRYATALVAPRTNRDATASAAEAAATLEPALRRTLLSRSTPWAELPPGETRDPAKLLADTALLAAPMDLPEAEGRTATIYRAAQGEWQFNLHSFIAHHDGKFWAIWSSGRVNEDSSSQLIRYATSVDGFAWSEAAILAPDPDGERGPWRWMASGIYTEGGRLFALGSLNRGSGPEGPWTDARLVRFEWRDGGWNEDHVVANDCVVYFPPLRIEGRDFFVWRDSRAWFYTGFAPAGTDDWTVTRVPGPLPMYRMSETSAFVGPDGVVHLIISDQGYTHRLYHAVSYDAGGTWTVPVRTNYPDAVSKNMSGRLSTGLCYLINNPSTGGAAPRDPLAISFSRDGWTFSAPVALRKNAPALRYKGGAKGSRSFQYSHAIEYDGRLWVIYATNKEDIEVSAFPIEQFAPGLTPRP